MAEQTKQQLIDRSEEVRTETQAGANSAERVGSLVKDISENLVHQEQLGEGFVKQGNVFKVQETLFSADDFEIINNVIYIKNSPNAPTEEPPIIAGRGSYIYSNNGTTFPHTVTFTGSQTDDILVAAVWSFGGSDIPMTPPAGWTEILNQTDGYKLWIRKKLVGDSDSFVWTQTANRECPFIATIIRGADILTYITGTPLVNSGRISGSITGITAVENTLVLTFLGVGGTTLFDNVIYDETWGQVNASALSRLNITFDKVIGGATGNFDFTLPTLVVNGGIMLGFRPEPNV